MNNITLSQIEEAAKQFSIKHAALKEITTDLHNEVGKIVRQRIAKVKSAANEAAAAQAALLALVDAAPELFVKPRSHVLHGVKVGFKKSKGSIEWDDDETLIKRINKFFSEEKAELLIITNSKPSAEALRALPASELAKLGVRLVDNKDVPIAGVVTDDIEKFVAKMVEESIKEAEKAA